MQIQIVRHDGRTKNADGDVKHFAVRENTGARNESLCDARETWFRENHLCEKAAANGENQNHYERFDVTKSFVLQIHHRQNVERGDAHPGNERNVKKQFQCDGRAKNLRKIARTDRDFTKEPQ